jgi:hypothetical protein
MRRHRRTHSGQPRWLRSPIAAVLGALAFAVLLAGCSELPQDGPKKQAGTTVTRDTAPWTAEKTPYSVAGFVKDDKSAYEHALKQRTLGQHEYVRIGDAPPVR